jgi:DNA-directed RNA polymerase subunit RPC12/RpoP
MTFKCVLCGKPFPRYEPIDVGVCPSCKKKIPGYILLPRSKEDDEKALKELEKKRLIFDGLR